MRQSVQPYKSTPVFEQFNLPAALQKAHCTKAGTWGILEILEGHLLFTIADSKGSRQMNAGDRQAIQPEQLHHVTIVGPVKCQIHFYRKNPEL